MTRLSRMVDLWIKLADRKAATWLIRRRELEDGGACLQVSPLIFGPSEHQRCLRLLHGMGRQLN